MTIKELAYSAQQSLQARTGSSFKRAHIYELLAASYGFNSYAALSTTGVFTRRSADKHMVVPDNVGVRRRCVTLGYETHTADLVASVLPAFLAERQIGTVKFSDLVAELRGESFEQEADFDFHADDSFDDRQDDLYVRSWGRSGDESVMSITLEGLEIAASKNVALAHYALALLYPPDNEEKKRGSSYWHAQALQGHILTGVEKEWADAHAAYLVKTAQYEHHLREAARLGQQYALLDLAEQFDDPAFFEQEKSSVTSDPVMVAELAERLGRPADARTWLVAAAEAGDTDAIRRLIADYDYGDLKKCWTWLYLAELHGTDLTQDDYHAIHENGSSYDDDAGGSMFIDGCSGVNIGAISVEQTAAAKQAALDIFMRTQEPD